jgi:hypothetical protein
MHINYQFIVAILTTTLCGCVSSKPTQRLSQDPTYTWISNPPVQSLVSGKYDISISPADCKSSFYLHDNGCKGITLVVTNKTNKDINLVWDQTYFLDKDQTNGAFMFEGVVFSKRNEQKTNDIIFANSTFKKIIFPNNRVDLTRGRGWQNTAMGDGNWGIYLTLQLNGEMLHEKLTYSITHK